MLTQIQIQVSIDIDPIFRAVIDFLRFVTTLFEVISQSVPHIYHSALQLVPPSSMIRELYGHQSCSAISKVVNGITALEDSCMASVRVEISSGIWSPCGQFVATYRGPRDSIVEVRDANTLEVVSTLEPPAHHFEHLLGSASFSAGGHLLACCYSQ